MAEHWSDGITLQRGQSLGLYEVRRGNIYKSALGRNRTILNTSPRIDLIRRKWQEDIYVAGMNGKVITYKISRDRKGKRRINPIYIRKIALGENISDIITQEESKLVGNYCEVYAAEFAKDNGRAHSFMEEQHAREAEERIRIKAGENQIMKYYAVPKRIRERARIEERIAELNEAA